MNLQTLCREWHLRPAANAAPGIRRLASLLAALVFVLGGLASRAPAAAAASGGETGSIVGSVSNAATGAYLEGARVTLEPGGASVYTARDGRFSFSHVATGSYDIRVTYTGLDPQILHVEVRSNETSVHDVALSSEIYELSPFVVEGEREGNAAAITQQRNAPNVKNVVSSDAFGNVADLNIANFLQRLPGFSTEMSEGEIIRMRIRGTTADLNSITVDGTRVANGTTRTFSRGADIDRLSADFIETIEVIKAITPDIDADSIGGTVNLKTKSALDRKGRRITYNIGQNYNIGKETFRPLASASYSNIFMDGKLGVLLTGSYNESHKPRDNSAFHWQTNAPLGTDPWFNVNASGQDFLQHRRAGLAARVDYKLSDATRFYVSSNVSYYKDKLRRYWVRLNSPSASSIVSVGPNVTETQNQTFRHHQRPRDRDVQTTTLVAGGESDIWGGKLDFNISSSWSKGTDEGIYFDRTISGVGFRQEKIGNHPRLTQISGNDVLDWDNSTVIFDTNDYLSRDRIYGGQINFRKPLETEIPIAVKAGARVRSQRRMRDQTEGHFTYVGPDGVPGPVGAANDDNLERFYDAGYRYQPNDGSIIEHAGLTPQFMDLTAFANEVQQQPNLVQEDIAGGVRDSIINDMTVKETVSAAYIMAEMQFGRLGILGGVRFEDTSVDGTGHKQEVTPEEQALRDAWVGPLTTEEIIRRTLAEYGNEVRGSASYHNYFPSIHFKYEFSERLLARASFSTGIGRPNFSQIVPSITVDHDDLELRASNPGLRPQFSDNYDLTLEYYFPPAGMLALGVFEKRLTDFIYTRTEGELGPDNPYGPQYEGYEFTTSYNGGRATIRGLEASYQQQFSSLPGFWSGFGVFGNVTWLETKGEYSGPGVISTEDELTNFQPLSGNIGISYIGHGWTIRALANYRDTRLGGFSSNPQARRYIKKSVPVDFHISYAIRPELRIYADVINAFNVNVQDQYMFNRSRPVDTLTYTTIIKFGLSGSF